jgi:hypothetical protein
MSSAKGEEIPEVYTVFAIWNGLCNSSRNCITTHLKLIIMMSKENMPRQGGQFRLIRTECMF